MQRRSRLLSSVKAVTLIRPGRCVGRHRQELENFRAGQPIGQTIIISNAAGEGVASADGSTGRMQSSQWWRPKGWQVCYLACRSALNAFGRG